MEGSKKEMTHVLFSQMAPAKPPLGSGSPFQAHKVENPPTSTTGAVSGATTLHHFTAQPDQAEAAKAKLGLNFDPNMDPKKLRRIMSNRLSAQRSRMKKLQYLANLELQAKTYEAQIAGLQPQLEFYESKLHSLLLEHETLDHQVATLQKETLLRDAEIEKNKLEVNMLRELHVMQQEQLMQEQMNASLQPPMSNDPISNYYSNPHQAPTQSDQMWRPGVPYENETNLTDLPNINNITARGIDGDGFSNPKCSSGS